MFTLVLLSLLIQMTLTHGNMITVSNGGPWGEWGHLQRCRAGNVARGFTIKVEDPINGDDTAMNGIKLYCAPTGSLDQSDPITSKVGDWGKWRSIQWCPSGYLISFSLMVEPNQGDGDDTAANSIMMQCSDHSILKGDGGPWGHYENWSERCKRGICGIKTRVEPSQGRGDDTALNDVTFECC